MKEFILSLLLGTTVAFGAAKIQNADIKSNAAIAFSKMAALTTGSAVVTDGSGVVIPGAASAVQVNYLAAATGTTGTQSLVLAVSPTLVSPALGIATAASISAEAGIAASPSFSVPTGSGNAGMYHGAGGLTFPYNGNDILNFNSTSARFQLPVNFASGTLGSPAVRMSDGSSGLYRIAANNHGWSVNGVKLLDLSSALLGVTGSVSVSTFGAGVVRSNSAGLLSVAGIQALDISDPELAALGGLTSAADKIPYFTGLGTASLVSTGSTMQFSGGTLNVAEPATHGISAVDIDWSVLKNRDGLYVKALTGNITLTFSNMVPAQTIVIQLTNTASNFTVGWPAAAHFPENTAPTQTIGAKFDIITCKAVSSTVAACQSVQDFTP